MTRTIFPTLLAMGLIMTLCNCSDDYASGGGNGGSDPSKQSMCSMATVSLTQGGCLLTPDTDFPTAYAPTNPMQISEKGLNLPGQRLLVEYRETGKGTILVMRIREALTKDVTNATSTNEPALGNDDVYIQKAWLGGGYLNLIYRIYYASIDAKHTLEAQLMPQPDSDGRPVVTIRHQANGDGHTSISVPAYASFRLTGTAAQAASIRVNYQWGSNAQTSFQVATSQSTMAKGDVFF